MRHTHFSPGAHGRFAARPGPGPAPAVLIPPDEHMGLDIARSLAGRAVPVYGLDGGPPSPARYSRCCRFVRSPRLQGGEAAYLQHLLDFGRSLHRPAVLFPLSDEHALFCSRHRDALQERFELVLADPAMLESLSSKHGLALLAERYGIPAPKTIFVTSCAEADAAARRIPYPAILKPVEGSSWHTPLAEKTLRQGLLGSRAKVVLCRDAAELRSAYRMVAPLSPRLIVQEVIPGEDSRLAYISFYLDRLSRPLGLFAGRKLRVIPIGFGSASYVRSFRDPALEEPALRLLAATGYRGLGGIEFKKDPRDETYKLIEFNTRFGMWDGLSVRCGVDLPWLAYRDTLHLPVEPQTAWREGVIWLDWQRDLRAALEYWRRGLLSPGGWLRSLRGEKMWAIYSRRDWGPGAAFTFSLIRKLWRRVSG